MKLNWIALTLIIAFVLCPLRGTIARSYAIAPRGYATAKPQKAKEPKASPQNSIDPMRVGKRELGTELQRLRDQLDAFMKLILMHDDLRKRSAKATTSKEMMSIWKQFMSSSYRYARDLRKTGDTLKRVELLAKSLGVSSASIAVPQVAIQSEIRKAAEKAKLPAAKWQSVIKRLSPTNGKVTLLSAIHQLSQHADLLDKSLENSFKRVENAKRAKEEIGRATAYLDTSCDPSDPACERPTEIVCTRSEGEALICGVIFIVAVVQWLVDLAEEANTDEGPRARFSTASCEELNAIPTTDLIPMLENLSRGPTLDGDERAILRLFRCLPCTRVAEIWNSDSVLDREEGKIGGRLLYDFDGDEFDQLIVRLHECAIIRFADFDDDSTRLFVNSHSCEVLSRLSNEDRRQLILHLFSGSTGDDDEAAIIKLIECLPLYLVSELLAMPGLSYGDFDDEVDGSEWTRLRRTLDAARVVWPR